MTLTVDCNQICLYLLFLYDTIDCNQICLYLPLTLTVDCDQMCLYPLFMTLTVDCNEICSFEQISNSFTFNFLWEPYFQIVLTHLFISVVSL